MKHTLPVVKHDLKAPDTDAGVKKWLEEHASPERPFLLAYAYDGVIWGKYDGNLKTVPTAFDKDLRPELDGETLQQAHLFGDKEELRLFRNTTGSWQASLITDADVEKEDRIDEFQLLWGNKVEGVSVEGYTHVRDRVQQAMDHVLPLDLSELNLDDEGPRLQVRHYIAYDEETGEARIFLSRLVHLGIGVVAEERMK